MVPLAAVCAIGLAIGCQLLVDSKGLSDQKCPVDQKPCVNLKGCVHISDPATGCGNESCAPCEGPANTVARCSEGRCEVARCISPFDNCDALPDCETDLDHNPEHCGGCNQRDCAVIAPVANGYPGCSGGTCTIGGCMPGFDDCDRDRDVTEGCEDNLLTSDRHCGACNQACESGATCTQGTCLPITNATDPS
jgi:hypothetical protein